uniref:carboxylesterase/lipase family protein n=1 Tax=Paenibacillus turpanensis TaxID=2689078 RepID=UPI00140BB4B6
MKRIMIVLFCCLFLLTSCSSSSITTETETAMKQMYGENKELTGDYNKKSAVVTNNGTYVGKEEKRVVSYKGIPYAKPPVGKLRWKPPVEVDKSNKVFEAYYFGKSGIQTKTETERASYYEQGEDNLSLNIWTSSDSTSPLKPVMVYIHGGSYGWGGTSDPMYDGHNFVEAHPDVILVTINYRIGMMGFIDFSIVPGGEHYSDSRNLGILDQIMALKWIQQNITNFGGNASNVTIFGESAGGGSVSVLMSTPAAKGLFSRAIAQSGSIALTYGEGECLNLTQMLMQKSGASTMDDLLALSEEKLTEFNKNLNEYNCFPTRDGKLIPNDLYKAYEQGAGHDVDLLIGTNADEARYWVGEIGGLFKYKLMLPILYQNNVTQISKEDKKYVNAFMNMQDDQPIWKMTEFYNEVMFRVPAILQAQYHANNSGNTYMYYWTYPSAIKDYGAAHAVELAYVFNNLDQTLYNGNNINKELASTVQEMWVNFAKTGNPSTSTLKWPQYNQVTRTTMVLGSKSHVEDDVLGEQRKMIEPLMKYHFNGRYSELSLWVPHVYKLVGVAATIFVSLLIITIFFVKRIRRLNALKQKA